MKTQKNSKRNLIFSKETISMLNYNDLEVIYGGSYGKEGSYGFCEPMGTSKCPPANGASPISPATGSIITFPIR